MKPGTPQTDTEACTHRGGHGRWPYTGRPRRISKPDGRQRPPGTSRSAASRRMSGKALDPRLRQAQWRSTTGQSHLEFARQAHRVRTDHMLTDPRQIRVSRPNEPPRRQVAKKIWGSGDGSSNAARPRGENKAISN